MGISHAVPQKTARRAAPAARKDGLAFTSGTRRCVYHRCDTTLQRQAFRGRRCNGYFENSVQHTEITYKKNAFSSAGQIKLTVPEKLAPRRNSPDCPARHCCPLPAFLKGRLTKLFIRRKPYAAVPFACKASDTKKQTDERSHALHPPCAGHCPPRHLTAQAWRRYFLLRKSIT